MLPMYVARLKISRWRQMDITVLAGAPRVLSSSFSNPRSGVRRPFCCSRQWSFHGLRRWRACLSTVPEWRPMPRKPRSLRPWNNAEEGFVFYQAASWRNNQALLYVIVCLQTTSDGLSLSLWDISKRGLALAAPNGMPLSLLTSFSFCLPCADGPFTSSLSCIRVIRLC